MDNLVFLVKSHSPHLHYTKQLIETINQYNTDNIKTYLSVPANQFDLFKNNVDIASVELISDEEVIGAQFKTNWMVQQLVKMKFSQLKLCKNYFWIDGDSYFLRNFSIKDFMYTDEIPYTTMHENKDLFQWMATQGNLLENVLQSYHRDRTKVRELFNPDALDGKYFDWTCPNLWSCKVLDHMVDNYLEPNDLTFESLLQYIPGELVWYGEYLLATQIIPIIPCESWFKPFHYLKQMLDYKNEGHTEKTISENFLGIVMPSKETNQLRF
jgi:hypothetical protein